MSQRLYLAPRSNEQSRENFLATLESGYPLSEVQVFLNDEERKTLGSRQKLYIWGNREGKRNSWEKMRIGDYVAFYAKRSLVYVGRCLLKKQSPELARRLWGNVPKEEGTWEYTFFLDALRPINIPLEQIHALGGYKDNMVVQGFMPLNEVGMENLQKIFGSLEAFFGEFSTGLRPKDVLTLRELSKKSSLSSEEQAALDAIIREKNIDAILMELEQRQQEISPEEIPRQTQALRRNASIVQRMKEKFGNKCQICGFTFRQINGNLYSEAAHIQPLSSNQPGVDRPSNIVILCPNHHKMLDHGNLRVLSETEYILEDEKKSFLTPLFIPPATS